MERPESRAEFGVRLSGPNGAFPALLILGPSPLAQAVKRSLATSADTDCSAIMTRWRSSDALALLNERADIGVVLLLWQEADFDDLLSLVQSILWARGRSFKAVLVRSRAVLPERVGRALWELGVADLAFAQAAPSAALADALAVVMRDDARNRSLVSVSSFTGRFSAAKTLREVAALTLQVIHENGIGRYGGLFCFRGGAVQDKIMVLAGTGRYGGADTAPLEEIGDGLAVEFVRTAMRDRGSAFSDTLLSVYLKTPGDYEACIFLALTTPLTSWKQGFVDVLARTVATTVDQVQMAHRLLRTQHATITAMATLAEYRDVDTGEHVARVARAATEIAVALVARGDVPGIDDEFVDQIGLATILHDVGKIAIPESILLKPGPLSASERQAMQEHVVFGQDILLRAARRSDNGELLRKAAEIALYHHEKYDGGGYPSGLRGEDIPFSARIVALVDVFDALTNHRPYKEAWPVEKALDYIGGEAGRHFDPLVVDVFMQLEACKRSAKFIEWTESMSVGHDAIDFDHQRLIDIINRLWLASRHGNRRVIEFILDDLVNYTEFHFKREELLMEQLGFADLSRHCRIHRGFCRRIEELRWEYFQGIRDEPQGEILEFLTNWLNRHILEEDRALQQYTAAPRVPQRADVELAVT